MVDQIPGLSTLIGVYKSVKGARKEKRDWLRAEVIEPLLDEIAVAADGELPGERGERESEWENIKEITRDRMGDDLEATIDLYLENIQELNRLAEQEHRLARQYISRFPGGRIEDGVPTMTTEVVSSSHGSGHRDREARNNPVSSWAASTWRVFQSATSEEEFRAEIVRYAEASNGYQDSSLGFDSEAIEYWEVEQNNPNWSQKLWRLYEQGIIDEFHDIEQDREDNRRQAIEYAEEIEQRLRNKNQAGFFG